MSKTLIFTATYNESKNIEELIDQIFQLKNNLNLLIIDDNSPDKTYKIIEKLSLKYPNITLIKREKKLGLNTAHILAYDYAIKNKYDKLITLDADMSHDPKDIPKIINLLDEHAFVVGSRYMFGGKNDMTVFRFLLSYFGNVLIKFLLKCKGTEFTTSFRGFHLVKLKDFHFNQIQAKGYSFFMNTVVKLNRLGFESKEFPIHFKNRNHGKSKIPKIEIIRTLFNVLILYLKK